MAVPGVNTPNFVLVHFDNAGLELRPDAAELQHHIALGRGAVADDLLSVGGERFEQRAQVGAVSKDAFLEVTIGPGGRQAQMLLLA